MRPHIEDERGLPSEELRGLLRRIARQGMEALGSGKEAEVYRISAREAVLLDAYYELRPGSIRKGGKLFGVEIEVTDAEGS